MDAAAWIFVAYIVMGMITLGLTVYHDGGVPKDMENGFGVAFVVMALWWLVLPITIGSLFGGGRKK